MRVGIWIAALPFWLIWPAIPSPAAPFVFYRGIVNAAGFTPPGLPGGAIARGSIFTIFGRDLGPAEAAQVSAFPLEDQLDGVSIEVCQGNACTAAIPLFVRDNQINAVMRSDAPLGPVSIRVSYQGQAGNFSPARVAESNVGIFAANSAGFGPGIIQNFIAPDNQPLNSLQQAIPRGGTAILWATGLGPALGPDNQAPQAGDLPINVEIFIGGVPAANIRYRGRTPCCAGVDQIVFDVPADAPTGCYVPVLIRTNGLIVSNSVTMAVSKNGAACSDPRNPLEPARAAGRTGVMFLTRFDTNLGTLAGISLEYVTDFVAAAFQEEASGPFRYNRLFSLPPVGTCGVHTAAGDVFDMNVLPSFGAPGRGLDAGAAVRAAVGGTAASGQPLPASPGVYLGAAGDTLRIEPLASLLFDNAGPFTLSSQGGADVGAFQTEVPAPPGIRWTNREAVAGIDAPVRLTWTLDGPEAGLVAAFVASVARPQRASALTLCLADASSGEFTIPGEALANHAETALIGLGALPAGAGSFTAGGLNRGLTLPIGVVVKDLSAGR